MTSAGSVEGNERLRIFFGLPLPDRSADEIVRWQENAFSGSRDLRPLPREHLHVTLAFLGSRPASELAALGRALHDAAADMEHPVLLPRRYRETERVGMLVLEDRGGRATELQSRLSTRLQRLGAYKPEQRAWLVHLTVARFRVRPRIQPAVPKLEPISPSEAALYHSVLRPSGAQYVILESVALGG